jgi:ABC-2 type transport system ATP-binding protein
VNPHSVARQPSAPPVVPPAAIDARGLRKEFRIQRRRGRTLRTTTRTALDGATFRLEPGECIAILGPNGSGKSTLIRLLSTLLVPDGGCASILGFDLRTQAAEVRRLVNRVSVEASFFKRLSAVENLSYAARFYGLGPSQTRPRIAEILDRIGFPASRSGEPMENLSRGMQQKVALARALLTSPVLLLLDEPTTGLDPRSRLEVQALVAALRAEHEATIVLCTHDLAEAEALAGRVGILNAGELLALEPVADLRRRYGGASLEEVFFAATGRSIEDDAEDNAGDVEDGEEVDGGDDTSGTPR